MNYKKTLKIYYKIAKKFKLDIFKAEIVKQYKNNLVMEEFDLLLTSKDISVIIRRVSTLSYDEPVRFIDGCPIIYVQQKHKIKQMINLLSTELGLEWLKRTDQKELDKYKKGGEIWKN